MVRMIARTWRVLFAAVAAVLVLGGCADMLLRQKVEDLVTEYKLGYLPGSWSEPQLLETMAGGVQSCAAAIGSGAQAYVVWGHYIDAPDWSIYVNRYDGSAWLGAEEIDSVLQPSLGSAADPDVAVGADGYAFVIFAQRDATEYRPYARRFLGGSWTAGGYLDNTAYDMNPGESLQIGMSSGDKVVALWIEMDTGSISDVKARVRPDAASPWGSEAFLENPNGSAWWCRLAVAGDGSAVAAWEQQDGAEQSIYANRLVGTAWAGAAEIDGTTDTCHLPAVAVSEVGTAVVAWLRQEGATSNLYASRFNGTSWSAPVLLDSLSTPAQMPSAAMAVDGKALVVWGQSDGSADSIFSAFFDGSAWGSPVAVEHSDIPTSAEPARVAFAPDGTAIAVWTGYYGGYGRVFYNHFDGGSWGQEAELSLPDVGSEDPVLDISPEGDALVAWKGQPLGTSDWNVYASIYRP